MYVCYLLLIKVSFEVLIIKRFKLILFTRIKDLYSRLYTYCLHESRIYIVDYIHIVYANQGFI